MLKNSSKEIVEGVMTVVGNWPAKGQEKIVEEFVEKTGEPWITQDSLSTYGDMWIFKEALEKAGAADGRRWPRRSARWTRAKARRSISPAAA